MLRKPIGEADWPDDLRWARLTWRKLPQNAMTLEKRFERVIVDCPFLFLLNQLRVILAKGGIMPDVVQTNHPINYFQRKTIHQDTLCDYQVRIGGTMHPCPRLAKRPVQRRKAAISLLGEREFYEDFEDFFLTPQGTIYL